MKAVKAKSLFLVRLRKLLRKCYVKAMKASCEANSLFLLRLRKGYVKAT